jgi:hypothetical protein
MLRKLPLNVSNPNIHFKYSVDGIIRENPHTWTHRYLAPGDYVITATATDENRTWNANTVQIFVP